MHGQRAELPSLPTTTCCPQQAPDLVLYMRMRTSARGGGGVALRVPSTRVRGAAAPERVHARQGARQQGGGGGACVALVEARSEDAPTRHRARAPPLPPAPSEHAQPLSATLSMTWTTLLPARMSAVVTVAGPVRALPGLKGSGAGRVRSLNRLVPSVEVVSPERGSGGLGGGGRLAPRKRTCSGDLAVRGGGDGDAHARQQGGDGRAAALRTREVWRGSGVGSAVRSEWRVAGEAPACNLDAAPQQRPSCGNRYSRPPAQALPGPLTRILSHAPHW